MRSFLYSASPARVLFGVDVWSTLKTEVAQLGAGKALVLCSSRQRALGERAVEVLGELGVGIHDRAVMHVPISSVQEALDALRQAGAGCLVAIGGGSTIGLAKGMALQASLPILAVPTTYSGSEMTSVYGVTENGIKRTGKDPGVLPATVIYDPSLSMQLRVDTSVVSGLNAIAHAAEGLYAKDGNPLLSLIAQEGIRAMAGGLRQLVQHNDMDARRECLYGAWLCGMVLGGAGMSLHHKLCHTLGGSFSLPHAETHAVLLPHAMAYNAAAAQPAMECISSALGCGEVAAPKALHDLAHTLRAPLALRDIGMKESELDEAANIATAQPYWNPRPIDRDSIRALLQAAYEGRTPHNY